MALGCLQDTTLNLQEDEIGVVDFATNLYYDLNDYQFDNEDLWDFCTNLLVIFLLWQVVYDFKNMIFIIDFVQEQRPL